jgi:hypothetical protein
MAVKSLKRSSVKSTQKTNAMLAGYSFQDFELIESVFLASSAASITFSNLQNYANDYAHLQVRWTARTPRVSGETQIFLQTNSNTSANYGSHSLVGTGTAVTSGGDGVSNPSIGFATTANSPANAYGAGVVDILDAFSSTKNKTIRLINGASTSPTYVSFRSFFVADLSPISLITISDLISLSLLSGSRFSLYGIR